MKPLDALADGLVALYGLNRRGPRLRGGYRLLREAGKILPKLHRYPIHFPETSEVYADVDAPDTYWLLNAFLGDMHHSLHYLAEMAEIALKPGDVVWDVGASLGLFSLLLAQSRFRLSSMHLFEPHPSPFEVARGLLGKNPIVHLHPFGLGKSAGNANLYFKTGSGSASIKPASETGLNCVTCRIESGDTLLAMGEVADAPDLIKIDVEGFEAEVIQGLRKTISAKKPVVFFEIIFLSDEVVLGLVPENYRIAFIRDKDGRLINDLKGGRDAYAQDAIMAPSDSNLWSKLGSRFIS